MRLGLKTFVKDFEKATLTGEEEAGRTLEEGIEIAKLLESYGYDCLNVDTGIYDSFYYACPPMYMPKGYAMELAAQAKAEVHIPVLLGGRMNNPDIGEAAIRDRKIDAVVLGRSALADPAYPNKVLTRHRLSAVGDGAVTLTSEKSETTIPADNAVIAVGFRPAPSMAAELTASGMVVYEIIGQNIGTIMRAIWSGYELGNNI